ncbi:MAG: hypothetical protein ACXACY_16960 [Candidatus Hodarchaeales archaeon]|jgi:hypothetical protein
MRKVLFVIANYPDQRQQFFDNNYSPLNQKFASQYGYDYVISDGGQKFRGNFTWSKFTIVRDMIKNGELKHGDKLVHLDADMRINKFDQDFPCEKSFSYSIDTGNSHCMGCYAINVNDWSINMIDLILSEERYNKLNDKVSVHEHFGYANAFWHEFREQASWYSLAGIKRHSSTPFEWLPNHGWHSALDEDTVYSLDELNEHVQILPTEWNVTQMEGESNTDFNINKVRKEDVIIRHYAGGQQWRVS